MHKKLNRKKESVHWEVWWFVRQAAKLTNFAIWFPLCRVGEALCLIRFSFEPYALLCGMSILIKFNQLRRENTRGRHFQTV